MSRTIEAEASDKIVNKARQLLARSSYQAQRETMEEAPAQQALTRIEAALDRIATARERLASRPAPDADLARRHEALKASVERSLADLDLLLASRD